MIEFTRRGWIEVWEGDRYVSRHTVEREAIERVANEILRRPAGTHSTFEIRGHTIVAKGYGVLSPGGVDTEAPTVPGSFAGTALSATRVSLTWTASTDNIGVTGYQVFRNGSPLTTVTGLSFTDTGLAPATQYSYTITAYDAAGNNSGLAGPALVTTLTNSAPVWSIGNQSFNNGTAVNISLDGFCSDADGDPITYSLVSGTLPTGLALSGARNQTLSGTVTADGAFNFTLGASDGIAARQDVSLTFTVSTPDVIPPDPPSAPTVLTFTSSTITLTLPVSAASDHASYTIQRSTNGTDYGTRATGITTATWQDTGLNASTAYWYRLIDVDTSANASSPGSAVSQTTAEANDGSNASRIAAILNGRSPHFAYNTPADPVTTREVTVTSASQFNTEAAVAGTRILVNSSFSGNVTINVNDIDVVMSNSATITGNLTIALWNSGPRKSRIRWTGGNISGAVLVDASEDVLLDDLSTQSSSSVLIYGGNSSAEQQGVDRFAMINSSVAMSGGDNFALFMSPVAHEFNDIILANCVVRHTGGGQTFRMQNNRRVLILDSVLNPDGGSNGFRLHLGCNQVWVRDTWVRNGINLHQVNGGDPGPSVTDALFDNFDHYADDPGFDPFYSNSAGITNSNTGTLQNSTLYRTRGSGVASITNFTNGGGNGGASWDGSTLPDYSSVGAVRS